MAQDRRDALNDSPQAERNAFLFGWHIGFYNFALVTAANETGTTLTQESRQLLGGLVSRVEEYIKYFGVEVYFKTPTSPSDARLLWTNLEQIDLTERGSSFTESSMLDMGDVFWNSANLANRLSITL